MDSGGEDLKIKMKQTPASCFKTKVWHLAAALKWVLTGSDAVCLPSSEGLLGEGSVLQQTEVSIFKLQVLVRQLPQRRSPCDFPSMGDSLPQPQKINLLRRNTQTEPSPGWIETEGWGEQCRGRVKHLLRPKWMLCPNPGYLTCQLLCLLPPGRGFQRLS